VPHRAWLARRRSGSNAITEPPIARKILDHLGWRAVPVRPRVRDPADDEFGRVGASSAAE